MKYDIRFLRITRRLSPSQLTKPSPVTDLPQKQRRNEAVEAHSTAVTHQISFDQADVDFENSGDEDNDYNHDNENDDENDNNEDDNDDDDLILSRATCTTTIIHYDILHSPTYRAPLLYLTPATPISLTNLYRMLIPQTHAPQIRALGPLGAVTLTEHPALGGVAYLVHPCRTGEAMAGMDESVDDGGLGYLMRWIGIVGVGVGLSVPWGVAEAVVSRSVGAGVV